MIATNQIVELVYNDKVRQGRIDAVLAQGKSIVVETSEGFRTFTLAKCENLKIVE